MTITWRDVTAPNQMAPAYMAASGAKEMQAGFDQLGTALQGVSNVDTAQKDRELTGTLLNVQRGQEQAAAEYRKQLTGLRNLPGIADVNSITGAIKIKSPEEIAADYSGAPEGRDAYIKEQEAIAKAHAAEFVNNPKLPMDSDTYNSIIRDTAAKYGKAPDQIKEYQSAFSTDINKNSGTTEGDKINLDAANAGFEARRANEQLAHETQIKTLMQPVEDYKKSVDKYVGSSYDSVLQEKLTGENWDNTSYERVSNNIKTLAPSILREIDPDGKIYGGVLPPQVLAKAIDNTTTEGGDYGWEWINKTFSEKDLKNLPGHNEYQSLAARIKSAAQTDIGMKNREIEATRAKQVFNQQTAQAMEQKSKYLYQLQIAQQSAHDYVDPRLFNPKLLNK